MTKKDFEMIAAVLAQERPYNIQTEYARLPDWDKGAYDEWSTIRLRFATRLAFENPTFDAERFNEACHAPD